MKGQCWRGNLELCVVVIWTMSLFFCVFLLFLVFPSLSHLKLWPFVPWASCWGSGRSGRKPNPMDVVAGRNEIWVRDNWEPWVEEVRENYRKKLQARDTSPCAMGRNWDKNNWVGTVAAAEWLHAVGSPVTEILGFRHCGCCWCWSDGGLFAVDEGQSNSCHCLSRLAAALTCYQQRPWRRSPFQTTPRYNRNLHARQICKATTNDDNIEHNNRQLRYHLNMMFLTCTRPPLGLPTWWIPQAASDHSIQFQSRRQLSEWEDQDGYLHSTWCNERLDHAEVFQETSDPEFSKR